MIGGRAHHVTSPSFARRAVAVAASMLGLALSFAPASARQLLSATDGAMLDGVLAANPTVPAVLGSAIDVLGVQPIPRDPHAFIVEVATPDHEKGLRLVVDRRQGSVVGVTRLAAADVPYTAADVESAFTVARATRTVQALLGAHLPEYRVWADEGAKPEYRVGGLVVRGMAAGDPCAIHRCMQLLFHAPSGYVASRPLLVDLTVGKMFGAPASAKDATGPQPRPRLHTISQFAKGTNEECRTLRFADVASSWDVCWYFISGPGLVLGPVSYVPAMGTAPFRLLDDARVDQIFVPYASGYPRFYDTDFGYPELTLPADVCGQADRLDGGTACLQRQDRGVDWLFGGGYAPSGREGEQYVLWSVLNADNYQYVERWIFRDDGSFAGEVEATGQNLPGEELESHSHDYIWRITPHLAGAGNSVAHTWVYEPVDGLAASEVVQPVLTPAGFVWDPQRFDALDVYAPGVTNGLGHQISYRLIPEPVGGLAHHEELFTRDDLWATSGDPTELDAFDLPAYASEKVPLVNTAVTLWYRGSYHHQPRDEDGFYTSHGGWIGVTHASPVGFVFQPRNLYDHSPFFPPQQQTTPGQ